VQSCSLWLTSDWRQAELEKRGLWDDAGRTLDALAGWVAAGQPLPVAADRQRGAGYDRVYVDEVQDFTQAEIALLFLAADMRAQVTECIYC
jgi:hypothetical protein